MEFNRNSIVAYIAKDFMIYTREYRTLSKPIPQNVV